MESDALGNVHFIERQKVGVLKALPSNQFELNYMAFNKIKSAWNDDLANVVVLDDQNILFVGSYGSIHYSPAADLHRAVMPSVYLKSIVNRGVEDKLLYQSSGIKLDLISKLNGTNFHYSQNSFEFEVVSPNFESGKELMYQYKLDGF